MACLNPWQPIGLDREFKRSLSHRALLSTAAVAITRQDTLQGRRSHGRSTFIDATSAVLSKHYDENNLVDIRTILTYSLKYYIGIALPCVSLYRFCQADFCFLLTTQQIATNGYLVIRLLPQELCSLRVLVLVTKSHLKRKQQSSARYGCSAPAKSRFNFGSHSLFRTRRCCATTFLAFLLAFVLTTIYHLDTQVRRERRIHLRRVPPVHHHRPYSVLMESRWAPPI